MKQSAYLALNNGIMKRFLSNCGQYNIGTDPNEKYDILFCDTLILGEKVKAKNCVYLACNHFEQINNYHAYNKYQYFIGFGKNIYALISEKFILEPSCIIDGFVYDQEYENSFPDENIDLTFVSSYNHVFEHEMFYDLLEYFAFDKKVCTNYEKIDSPRTRIMQDLNIGSRNFIFAKNDELPLKYMNNSNFVFFTSGLNCRMYFKQNNFYSGRIQTLYLEFIKFYKLLDNLIMPRGINFFSLIKEKKNESLCKIISEVSTKPISINQEFDSIVVFIDTFLKSKNGIFDFIVSHRFKSNINNTKENIVDASSLFLEKIAKIR